MKKPQSTDLCDSCQHVGKIKGYGREIKVCRSFAFSSVVGEETPINFPVETCTAYEHRGGHTRYELEEMAVYIEKRKDGAGFKYTKHVDGNSVDFK